MRSIFRTVSIALLLSVVSIGCRRPAPPPPASGLPTVPMQIGAKTYTLEIAADTYSREKGLMERDSMPADHGMIFVFDADTKSGFWMHHTRFPLDILFITQTGQVDSVRQMKAYDESSTYSDGPYHYAIELNLGAAADCGVKAGDQLQIPQAAASAIRN